MAQTATRRICRSAELRSDPIWALWTGGGALKLFLPDQASQLVENIDPGRENPRKSKSFRPLPDVHLATKPWLAYDIQTMDGGSVARPVAFHLGRLANRNPVDLGEGANFSRLSPCNPLKRNDRQRFARKTAENGGLRAPEYGRKRLAARRKASPRQPPAARMNPVGF
jgi:hypothetical protein